MRLAFCGVSLFSSFVLAQVGAVTPPVDPVAQVATKRVLFGHQSVGGNMLDGVRELAGARVSIRELDRARPDSNPAPGLVHFFAGTNEDPQSKLRDFEAMVDRVEGHVDVAMLKLCYVDFNASTDASTLADQYLAMLARLRAKYPAVTFVAVTAPLTLVQGGLKGWVKHLLGGAWGERENPKRHAFNEKLRAQSAKHELFDLALVESRRADGQLEQYEFAGASVPKLRSDFTDDGGHLNGAGRRAVAQAWLDFVGALSPAATR